MAGRWIFLFFWRVVIGGDRRRGVSIVSTGVQDGMAGRSQKRTAILGIC